MVDLLRVTQPIYDSWDEPTGSPCEQCSKSIIPSYWLVFKGIPLIGLLKSPLYPNIRVLGSIIPYHQPIGVLNMNPAPSNSTLARPKRRASAPG